MSDTLIIDTDAHGICTLRLNRPTRHNAFDADMIEALIEALGRIGADPAVRVLVLTGEGESFCSGADLEWMRRCAGFDEAANRRDAERLAALMRSLYELPKPTIARINGPAFGGGLGLIACCDIGIALSEATFAFSEVRLGLIPAVISPYVITAIGTRQAHRLFLTGQRLNAQEAMDIGLVHAVVAGEALDKAITREVKRLLQAGPVALQECKRLIRSFDEQDRDAELAAWIAALRVSPEGQAGLTAFLDKTNPPWVHD